MATYHERADLASDPVFVARTRTALVKYASYLTQQGSVAANDLRMAKSVLGAPDHWAQRFAIVLAAEADALSGLENDPAADTDAGDTALTYAVEVRVWKAFAAEGETEQ